MGSGTPRRADQAASTEPVAPADRRSWLSQGLAALAVSALGLAVAGSTSLTTNAEASRPTGDLPRAAISSPATGPVGVAPGLRAVPAADPAAAELPASLTAFAAAASESEQPVRVELQQAVVAERAAQRAEDLLKASEAATRAARDKSSEARLDDLAKAEQSARQNAVRIAEERLRRAVATRVAAQLARQQAESAAAAAAAAAAAENSSAARTAPEPATSAPDRDRDPEPEPAPEPESEESSPEPSGGGGSASPVPGAVVGAGFGQTGLWARYHTGLDFRAGHGTPIKAVKSGVVVFAGNKGNWAGNHVAIKHADGMTTMSSHMSSIAVRDGETVRAGRVIGRVGATGRAFGAHLHFELYPQGARPGDVYSAVNPQPWLRAQGVRTR